MITSSFFTHKLYNSYYSRLQSFDQDRSDISRSQFSCSAAFFFSPALVEVDLEATLAAILRVSTISWGEGEDLWSQCRGVCLKNGEAGSAEKNLRRRYR